MLYKKYDKNPFGHRWSWCKAGQTLQNLFGHRVEIAPGRFFICKNKKPKKKTYTSLLYSQKLFYLVIVLFFWWCGALTLMESHSSLFWWLSSFLFFISLPHTPQLSWTLFFDMTMKGCHRLTSNDCTFADQNRRWYGNRCGQRYRSSA